MHVRLTDDTDTAQQYVGKGDSLAACASPGTALAVFPKCGAHRWRWSRFYSPQPQPSADRLELPSQTPYWPDTSRPESYTLSEIRRLCEI